jgi:ribosomal protein S12 methylthiotransferase
LAPTEPDHSDQAPDVNPRPKATFSFVTLGCSKNLVDSERMLGLLSQDGYALVPEGGPADLVIVNTCGFIEAARQESLGVIRELVARKEAGEVRGVVVAGCLAEREKDRLLEEVPGIDQVVGVFGREEIARVADRILAVGLHEQRSLFRPAAVNAQDDRARLRITPRHLAYLKVSEGCDRLCTFCSIPLMRGKHVSKPIEAVVAEARELAADGVRELNLVAQDMTYYGLDIYGRPRLADLLRAIEEVDGLEWVRILYNYPQFITDELIQVIATSGRIVPYLDMPLQHANDRMLKRMNRKHTRAETESILGRLRSAIPGLVMRTTFVVGFPGETDEEFEDLLRFVEQWKFERLGVFTYSYEPDTPSAKLPDHLPEEVKASRRLQLMTAQQEVAFEFNRSFVGRTMEVLIDGAADDEPGLWVGRTYADAPDVDGQVFVAGSGLAAGDLLPCSIVDTDGYDLMARAGSVPPRRKRTRPASSSSPRRVLPPAKPSSPFPILG